MSGFHPYAAVLRQQLEERQDLELVLLEAALDDEIKCESSHKGIYSRPCSGAVTSRLLADCGSINGCDSAAACWRDSIASWCLCRECDDFIRDHWSVVPI